MKFTWSFFCSLILSLMIYQFAFSQKVQTNGKVCGNLSAPCLHSKWKFQPHDLSFRLPQTLKWQTNYYSANFYAIILESRQSLPAENVDAECGGYFSESKRSKAQKQFPGSKVFASRFGCEVLGISYTNVNHKYNFLAVYAGETETAAKDFLKKVKAKGYASANVRKMQIILSYGD